MHVWSLLAFRLCEQSVALYVSPVTLPIFIESLARMTPSIPSQARTRVFELVKLIGGYAHLVTFGDFVLAAIVAPVTLPAHTLNQEKIMFSSGHTSCIVPHPYRASWTTHFCTPRSIFWRYGGCIDVLSWCWNIGGSDRWPFSLHSAERSCTRTLSSPCFFTKPQEKKSLHIPFQIPIEVN